MRKIIGTLAAMAVAGTFAFGGSTAEARSRWGVSVHSGPHYGQSYYGGGYCGPVYRPYYRQSYYQPYHYNHGPYYHGYGYGAPVSFSLSYRN